MPIVENFQWQKKCGLQPQAAFEVKCMRQKNDSALIAMVVFVIAVN